MSTPPGPDQRTPSRVLSHLGSMALVSVVLGVIVAGLALPFAGIAGIGARNVAESMDSLPQELEAKPLPQKTTIVGSRGKVIASVFDENRVNVSLGQVSKRMRQAIVAIEDYRFFEHGALDLKGTLRAFVMNQASDQIVQGGSTITQQMVKLTLLQQADTKAEREAATADTYARKLRELRYAIAFEENYSKHWILERYLNLAYFGDGAFGVQAAARHYFNKNAKNLKLREAAMLAGLVKNPTAYDPTNNPKAAKARRNVVLDRMAQLNVISKKRAEKVKQKGLGLHVQPTNNGCVNSRAPFFCDYVLAYLMADPDLGETREERHNLVYSGGLTIHTTVDLRFQRAAVKAVREQVYPTDQAIGALALVEPGTGKVKAVAQSRPMGNDKGETFLNHLVPEEYGDSNGFQAGSTFKVFVLASAIEQGVPLDKTIYSPETVTIPMSKYDVCNGEPYRSTEVWDPSNSTRSGSFNLYEGTRYSVNTFFAQLELLTGLCKPYRLAKDLGISLEDPDRQMVPSFTLGVADVSPLAMAEAYATFAARGVHCTSRPVTSIDDSTGHTIKEYPDECSRVLPKSAADAVNDILAGVTAPGGFGQYIAPSIPSAGKTGTTQDGKAVWFVGYTPQLSAAAMIAGANQQGQPIPLAGQVIGGSYISSASGSGFAGPMWGQALGVIEQWLKPKQFVPPEASNIQGVTTQVPGTSGMSVEAAEQALRQAGFEPVVGGSVNSGYTEGTVAYTSPGAGSSYSSGDTVVIYPSTGYVPPPPPEPEPEPEPDGGDGGGGNSGGGNGGGGNNGGGNGNGNGNGGGNNGGGGGNSGGDDDGGDEGD